MREPPALNLQYVSATEYRLARWSDVLGIASFDGAEAVSTRAAAGTGGIPVAHVSTPVLPAAAQVCEVWRCGESGESGQHNGVRFRRGGDVLFGCIEAHSPLHEATAEAYRRICATLDAANYPYLLRVWNYLPDINRTEHGGERYRQFNAARRHALRACGRASEGNVPAASALGSPPASPLVVYFLAGRVPPLFVENPRQVSAYRYPREYGAYPPSFSRAALVRQRGAITLFISGTASIVGHRSLHVGDTAAQTRETLANIEALLTEANRAARGARFDLDALACKVYVRRPTDLPLVRAELEDALGRGGRAIYLQADICRQDLLVEIEAAAMYPCAA